MADPQHRRGLLALGAVRTLMETPLYTATVRLQFDRPQKIRGERQ